MGEIIKNYKRFVNESVSSDIKSMLDVPKEVIETAKRIADGVYDRVKRPTFEFVNDKGLIMKFGVTDKDFIYIDKSQDLSLDLNSAAMGKRGFNVTLVYEDKISETFEVKYLVVFEPNEGPSPTINDDDEDNDFVDDYELHKNEFADDIDEDDVDSNIKRRLNRDIEIVDDDDDDDDDDELHEEFNPLRKDDWRKAGTAVRKGVGILSEEEAREKGLNIVNSHAGRKRVYDYWLEEDPTIAEKYLEYVGNHPTILYPTWNGSSWTDSGTYYDATGINVGK